MRVVLSRWGNSLGLRIPSGLAKDAKLAEGSILDVRLENGRLVAHAVEDVSLDALLERVTAENRHGAALDTRAVGDEAL